VQALHLGFQGSGGDGLALQCDCGAQALFDAVGVIAAGRVRAGTGYYRSY
jgi:hypothetical protein